jgi:hypothetical protein
MSILTVESVTSVTNFTNFGIPFTFSAFSITARLTCPLGCNPMHISRTQYSGSRPRPLHHADVDTRRRMQSKIRSLSPSEHSVYVQMYVAEKTSNDGKSTLHHESLHESAKPCQSRFPFQCSKMQLRRQYLSSFYRSMYGQHRTIQE